MELSNAKRIDLERSIVRGLIRHMKAAGFVAYRVNDGGEMVYVKGSEKAAMEAVFAVDESSLRFIPVSASALRGSLKANYEHGVLLIGGNGCDIISDWNYTDGDADGFNKAMDAYCDVLNARELS